MTLLVELCAVQGCAALIEHSDRALNPDCVLRARQEAAAGLEILGILCCSVHSLKIKLRSDGQERCDC